MNGNTTFSLIKPTAVKKGYIGAILNDINKGGFKIKALKMLRMSKVEAETFYSVHKERPFFAELTDFMSSGAVVAMILEKEDAVNAYRNFIGKTNPAEAAEGTIRQLYGTSLQANAVHGSDSDENARIEADFFFAKNEWF